MLCLSRQKQQQQEQEQLLSITMTSLLLRISIICHLVTAVLYFLPKKFRSLLPNSWKPNARQGNLSVDAQLPAPPAMNCSELNQVFRTFDRNGDGRISKEELNDSLENLGIFISDGDLTSMIRRIDADGDGCVDAEEFKALYQGIMEVRGQEQEEEDMREAFEVFDVNGDGYITVDELRSVLSLLGLKQGRTVEECRRMIRRVDGDGDGRVSFKEFREMMKGGGMEIEGWDF